MKIIVFIMYLFIFVTAKTVTFSEALNLTMKNNKELKAKELETKKAIKALDEAKGYNYGKLKFIENISRTNNAGHVFGMKLASREANFGDFGFNEFLTPLGTAIAGAANGQMPADMSGLLKTEPKDLNYPGARTNFETKLVYEIPIYAGGKISSAISMAKLQIKANEAKFSHDKKQLGLEVLKAYNGAVAAKKFIQMTKNAKIITNRFVKVSQNLYNNKIARIIDVKQSKIADKSIEIKLQEAYKKFELAIAYLRFLTSDDDITDVSDFKSINIDNNDLKSLQKNALINRDDYKWMKLNTITLKEKINFDSSDNYPTIGAHIEYGSNNDDIELDEFSKKDYYLAVVGLNYSIFDGGVSSIKKQKAKIDYYKIKNYFEYMKQGIRLEVEKNYLDLISSKKTLQKKIKIEKMAEDVLKETEDVYKNNLRFRTNMMYLLMQLENMLKMQAEVIMSQYNQTIISAKLKLSIGKSLQEL